MNKIAIYPGTFDPITHGHIDVIKKALKLLFKQVVIEQMKVGLIKETVIDISDTNFLNVKYWISKSHFEKGRKNWQKVSQELNEMGAIVSAVGGEGEINLSEDFQNYI